jgi:hypothetical protein
MAFYMTNQKNTQPKKSVVGKTLTFRYNKYRNSWKHLIEDKKEEAEENRESIMNAVRELDGASTREIQNYLEEITKQNNQRVKEEAQRKFENGEYTQLDRDKEIDKKSMMTIDLRTIQRWVKELKKKEGLLEKKYSRYYLSEKAKNDVRYFPKEFGKSVLDRICDFYIGSVEDDLAELVKRFSALILYTFIEAAAPVEDDSMSVEAKNKLAVSWIKDAIPTQTMFEYFLTRFKFESKKKKDVNGPIVQLDKKTIGELRDTFRSLYPQIHAPIMEVRESFMVKRKSTSVT